MAKKEYPDDDGRTIINMNVEGFGWYKPEEEQKAGKSLAGKSRKEKKKIFRSTRFYIKK